MDPKTESFRGPVVYNVGLIIMGEKDCRSC